MSWNRYLMAECQNPACERAGQKWSCVQLSTERDGSRVVACDECGSHITLPPAAPVPKKKRTWPYHNVSAGVTFESESHEQKYTKAHGLTAE